MFNLKHIWKNLLNLATKESTPREMKENKEGSTFLLFFSFLHHSTFKMIDFNAKNAHLFFLSLNKNMLSFLHSLFFFKEYSKTQFSSYFIP